MDVKTPPEKLAVSVSQRAEGKVALDIDDAPFLEEEAPPPEKKEERAAPKGELTPLDAEEKPSLLKNKKRLALLVGGGVLLCALLGGGALWWFVLRTPPTPPAGLEPEVIRVPSPPVQAQSTDFVIEFAPFWVEFNSERGGKDGVVFLTCKFAVLTQSDLLLQEARSKMSTLRDAVFYYLKNKPYEFLLDPANAKSIKTDLNSVLSGYLVGGKIDDILFESYLAK